MNHNEKSDRDMYHSPQNPLLWPYKNHPSAARRKQTQEFTVDAEVKKQGEKQILIKKTRQLGFSNLILVHFQNTS
ncbi:hypothetical protein DDZ16_17730 [Marinilabilia rubra]|uniref:Uncharacterized protein n=1 Tax=Marinilabilia rubra TaxID=2162893 RepID=A0A2U2B4P8_9BACT|nr:hypothetical protein DDZ16_17730 [Marinilabilia rubra]